MELAIFWLPLVGGTLLAFAVGAWYGLDKSAGVWLGFSGFVCFLLLAALQIQQVISASDKLSAPDGIVAQRAYVSVVDAELSTLSGDGHPTVSVTIRNTGQTPAYDLSWRATFAAREVPVTAEIPFDTVKEAPAMTLPSGGSLFYKWTFPAWGSTWDERIRPSNGQTSDAVGKHVLNHFVPRQA